VAAADVVAVQPAEGASAAGWTIEIQMPVRAGRPVGWLTLNNIKKMPWRRRYAIEQAWRKAAYDAFVQAGLPAGLGRIQLTIQFRFADLVQRDRDNQELTIKHLIDALKPLKKKVKTDKRGRSKVSVEWGVGAVADDSPRYIQRTADLPHGTPLGRKNPVRGIVVFHIVQLPEATT
jgi:hypothetical protein